MPSRVRLRYYYIDPSADKKAREATKGQRDFEYFIERAQHWARRAVARLEDQTDTDLARVFNVIFKTLKDDDTPYPDSGEWQHRYARKRDAYWLCTEAHVISVLKDFSEIETAGTFEHVSNINPQILASQLGEKSERYVIGIGTDAWKGLVPFDLDKFLGKEADFDRMDITLDDIISTSMTKLVLHEILKAPPYLLNDADAPITGCFSVMQCKTGEAHRNAVSVALLALWAVLADTVPQSLGFGGFTLDRTWDNIPGSCYDIKQIPGDDLQQQQRKWKLENVSEPGQNASPWYLNLARAGAIIQYRDITGRRP